jgi:hypothetical protein
VTPNASAAPVRASLARRLRWGAHNRNGRSYAVTSLTPIRPGQEPELKAHLVGLIVSPFAELEGVHFARWMIIDQVKLGWPGAPRRRTQLRSQYLLFTASITAPDAASARRQPESFLRQIAERIPQAADAVWGNCVGYPGASSVDAFTSYLRHSLLDSVLFHVGYRDVTVQQVRTALARRDALVRFIRAHQDVTDPAQLQQRYVAESATW